MSFSDFYAESPLNIEAPHEEYIRWATEFGLIEWLVGEDGEVYFTAAECAHGCMHKEDDCPEPMMLVATPANKKQLARRLASTAAAAVVVTMGAHQATVMAAPEVVYTATTGERITVRGHEVTKVETVRHGPTTVAIGAAPGHRVPIALANRGQRVEDETRDALKKKEHKMVAAAYTGVYHDHRTSTKGKRKKTTVLKTAKRTHQNKTVPAAPVRAAVPVMLPAPVVNVPPQAPPVAAPPVAAQAPAEATTAPAPAEQPTDVQKAPAPTPVMA